MSPWVKPLFGNAAWGERRRPVVASALAALAVPMAIAAALDYAEFRDIGARTEDALGAAARGAAIARGDGVARSDAEAADVARQIFRSGAPPAATAVPDALSVEIRRDGAVAVARWEGALQTPLGAFLHWPAPRAHLAATAAARANRRVVGVEAPAPASRL